MLFTPTVKVTYTYRGDNCS